MYVYTYIHTYIYIYIYIYTHTHYMCHVTLYYTTKHYIIYNIAISYMTYITLYPIKDKYITGCSYKGGCSGRGVQWIGVVLYSKTSIQHHTNHYTLFPLHPPLMNL